MSSSQGPRATWTNHHKKIVVELPLEEVKKGNKPDATLKRSSWARIIEGFYSQTGLKYKQKQFKNLLDYFRRSYNAWVKLVGQTGVGYNKKTRMVTMEPEKWDEYLRANPGAKQFRTGPLLFPDKMKALFAGTPANGQAACDMRTGSIPSDNIASSSKSIHCSQDIQDIGRPSHNPTIPNPSMEIIPNDGDDVDSSEGISGRSRCSITPPRDRCARSADKDAELSNGIKRLISTISQVASTGPTIAECVADLSKMEEIPEGHPLYMVAVKSFVTKEYREIWMSLTKPQLRIKWLQTLVRGD